MGLPGAEPNPGALTAGLADDVNAQQWHQLQALAQYGSAAQGVGSAQQGSQQGIQGATINALNQQIQPQLQGPKGPHANQQGPNPVAGSGYFNSLEDRYNALTNMGSYDRGASGAHYAGDMSTAYELANQALIHEGGVRASWLQNIIDNEGGDGGGGGGWGGGGWGGGGGDYLDEGIFGNKTGEEVYGFDGRTIEETPLGRMYGEFSLPQPETGMTRDQELQRGAIELDPTIPEDLKQQMLDEFDIMSGDMIELVQAEFVGGVDENGAPIHTTVQDDLDALSAGLAFSEETTDEDGNIVPAGAGVRLPNGSYLLPQELSDQLMEVFAEDIADYGEDSPYAGIDEDMLRRLADRQVWRTFHEQDIAAWGANDPGWLASQGLAVGEDGQLKAGLVGGELHDLEGWNEELADRGADIRKELELRKQPQGVGISPTEEEYEEYEAYQEEHGRPKDKTGILSGLAGRFAERMREERIAREKAEAAAAAAAARSRVLTGTATKQTGDAMADAKARYALARQQQRPPIYFRPDGR